MKLNLKRPLVIFDLETSGLDIANDRIVEISLLKIFPNGNKESKTFKINPTIFISPEATKVHGISDEDIKDAPTFKEISNDVLEFIGDCDLAGFNSNNFDLPLLVEEFLRVGIYFDPKKVNFVDAKVIFHKKEQRNLAAAYNFYCGNELEDAHSAKADVMATYEILKGQVERYDDLENDIEELSKYSTQSKNVDFAGKVVYDEEGRETFNFGKYKGVLVNEVIKNDPSYYRWVINNIDFPQYTRQVLTSLGDSFFTRVKH